MQENIFSYKEDIYCYGNSCQEQYSLKDDKWQIQLALIGKRSSIQYNCGKYISVIYKLGK